MKNEKDDDFLTLFRTLDIKNSDKQGILNMIGVLKEKKPSKWKIMAHKLTNELARREGVFEREFPKRRAAELVGRKCRKSVDCPRFDNFSDESEP